MNLIRDLQIIYTKLHYGKNGSANIELETGYAIKYLASMASQRDYCSSLYKDLMSKILRLRKDTIPTLFIERYCIARLCKYILNQFDCNVAEAYLLAYIALNDLVPKITVHFKLNASGLVKPTTINGRKFSDTEAITSIIVEKMIKKNLIIILPNYAVMAGPAFKIDLKS